ncbi:Hypothetical predicted protein [Podarcis lilfordi]|uniref:Uncharacterized protein n=1 Tax=Podarcis lilfordi TaxID=74358 RepID=A0AA35KE18_9SAUR|nr:Hypothetical predicted protein [Podarcis lilfordi]
MEPAADPIGVRTARRAQVRRWYKVRNLSRRCQLQEEIAFNVPAPPERHHSLVGSCARQGGPERRRRPVPRPRRLFLLPDARSDCPARVLVPEEKND